MKISKPFSIILGFLVLFFVYHFPEFFTEFWIMATFKIGFLLAAALVAKHQGLKGLQGLGLNLHQKWSFHLVIGLLVGITFFILSVMLSIQFGYDQVVQEPTTHRFISALPMILVMTIFPSLAEDILTRGYLFAHFKMPAKPFIWVIFSSIIYVLNHIWRLNDGAAVLSYLFLLGLVLAYAVYLTNSLWLAFGIHWGANITFESTHASLQSIQGKPQDASTWVLAGVWGLLLVLLLVSNLLGRTTNLLPLRQGAELKNTEN